MPSTVDPLQIIYYFYPTDTPLRKLLVLHSSQVCAKALRIAESSPAAVDLSVVRIGAMLHDIGVGHCHAPSIYCEGDAPYICHGTIGAQMLRHYAAEHGLDLEAYALICERHTGSGLTANDVARQQLPLEVRDYLPLSNEEKLITLADKFFSKSGDQQEKPLPAVRKSMVRFGVESLRRFDELCQLFGVKNGD